MTGTGNPILGEVTQIVWDIAASHDIRFVGVADMTSAWKEMERLDLPLIPEQQRLPRAITIGIQLSNETVDAIAADEIQTRVKYTQEFYGTIWPKARTFCGEIARRLEETGATAIPAPNYGFIGTGIEKMAARLAGLGWIGKSSMLITPQVGPRVLWHVVLTNALLSPTAAKPMERRCGKCRQCVDICPVQAYKDVPFDETDPLTVRFDATKCWKYRNKLGGQTDGDNGNNTMNSAGGCGLCVKVCPYGRSRSPTPNIGRSR